MADVYEEDFTRIKFSVTNHVGWQTTAVLADGDVFYFRFGAYGIESNVGLGRGMGTGNIYSKVLNLKHAVQLTSTSSARIYTSGSYVDVAGSYSSAYWSIERSGTDYVLRNYNTIVHTWTDATDYNVGSQGYQANTWGHYADLRWSYTASSPSGTVAIPAGQSLTYKPVYPVASGGVVLPAFQHGLAVGRAGA